LSHGADDDIGLGCGAKRIEFQSLASRVVTLDTEAANPFFLPHADKAKTVTWRKRHVEALARCFVFFPRSHVRVRRRRGEWCFSPSAEKLDANIVGWLLQVHDFVLVTAVHEDRVPNSRSEKCCRDGGRAGATREVKRGASSAFCQERRRDLQARQASRLS